MPEVQSVSSEHAAPLGCGEVHVDVALSQRPEEQSLFLAQEAPFGCGELHVDVAPSQRPDLHSLSLEQPVPSGCGEPQISRAVRQICGEEQSLSDPQGPPPPGLELEPQAGSRSAEQRLTAHVDKKNHGLARMFEALSRAPARLAPAPPATSRPGRRLGAWRPGAYPRSSWYERATPACHGRVTGVRGA
jgi:hypothetical protein